MWDKTFAFPADEKWYSKYYQVPYKLYHIDLTIIKVPLIQGRRGQKVI